MTRTRVLLSAVLVVLVAGAAVLFMVLRTDVTDGAPTGAGSAPPTGSSGSTAPSGQRTFLYLGDSLMKGYYASDEQHAWRELVTAGADGKELATIGGPGQTVPDVLQHFNERKVGIGANTVIIELGTNDVGHKVAISDEQQDYPQLLSDVKQRAAEDATILCLGAWKPTDEVTAFDTVAEAACKAAGAGWVPLSDLYDDSANRGPAGRKTAFGAGDDMHPNDAGHAAIAKRVLSALEASS